MTPPLLLAVPDAAASLSISESKLRGLIRDGAIPAVQVDRCRRVRVSDLVAYVERLGLPPQHEGPADV